MNGIISVVDSTLVEVKNKLNESLKGTYESFGRDFHKDLLKAYQLMESTTKILDDLIILVIGKDAHENINIINIDLKYLIDEVVSYKYSADEVINNLSSQLPSINGKYSDFYTIFQTLLEKSMDGRMDVTVIIDGFERNGNIFIQIHYRGDDYKSKYLLAFNDSLNESNEYGLELAVTKSLLKKY